MRRMWAVILFLIMGLLISTAYGQDENNAPVVTQEIIQDVTAEATLPTMAPLLETIEVLPTQAPPTVTPETIISTAEALPTEDASTAVPVPTVIAPTNPAPTPTQILNDADWRLAARELFAIAPVKPWSVPSDWTMGNNALIAVSADGAEHRLSPLHYEAALGDVQTQATVSLKGEGHVSLSIRVSKSGAYTAQLDNTGHVRLLRGEGVLAETALTLKEQASHTINLSAVGGRITLIIDGGLALTYTDETPLPAGSVEIGGTLTSGAQIVLDDVFIWGPSAAVSTPTTIIPTSTATTIAAPTTTGIPASAPVPGNRKASGTELNDGRPVPPPPPSASGDVDAQASRPYNLNATACGVYCVNLTWQGNSSTTYYYKIYYWAGYAYGWIDFDETYELNYTDTWPLCGIQYYAVSAVDYLNYESDLSVAAQVITRLCPPANDDRTYATELTTFPFTYEYSEAVGLPIAYADDDYGDPYLSCAFLGYTASLWYRYTPSSIQTISLNTINSTYDTVVGIYRASGIGGTTLTEVACADDIDPANEVRTSELTYELAPAQTYYILVAEWGEYYPKETDVARVSFRLLPRPTTPVLQTPVNNGATQGPLEWGTAVNADMYHLQVSTANTFANRLIDVYQTETTYDTTDDLPDGKYYWRVRAITSEGVTSSWSPVWTFTKDTVAPIAPTISLPANNATVASLKPSVTAVAIPGVTLYRWSIASAADWPTSTFVQTFNATAATTVVPNPLAQGQYYMWVDACDAAGNCGTTSLMRTFKVDLRQQPVDNVTVIVGATPVGLTFRWALPQGVTSYTLQVSTNDTFTGIVASQDLNTPAVTWTLPNIASTLGYGTFYWRLVLNGLPDVSDIVRRFVVSPNLPAAPKLNLISSGGLTNVNQLAVTWQPVTYAYGITYEIQVDNLSTFASPEYVETNISDPSHITTSLPDGIYYVRVRAVNEFGAGGTWSLAQKITIDTTAPLAPQITTPYTNGVVSVSRQPTIWKAVTGANRYKVQYSRTPTFDDLVVDTEVATATYTPTISLAQGEYFVRVAARDAALNWGNYSIPVLYTYAANTLPANNATSAVTRPVFRWAAVPGATQYQVFVSQEETCGFEIGTTQLARSPILPATTLSWTYLKDENGIQLDPLTYGTYYWCVLVNRGPGTPATAALFPNVMEMPLEGTRFNVSPSVPPAPVVTAPLANAMGSAGVVTIQWNTLANTLTGSPFTYEVQVDDSTVFNVPEFQAEGITGAGTSISIPTSALADGKYNARVRATNSYGGVGPWSIVRVFTVDTIGPNAPTLTGPADNAILSTLTPTITYTAVPGAARYRIEISNSDTFDHSTMVDATTISTVLPLSVMNDRPYYVRVYALDSVGNSSLPSASRTFKVLWPTTQTPPLIVMTNDVTLSWEQVAWATQYEVQIGVNSTFTKLIGSSFITTSTSVNTQIFPYGLYYWRVRAYDGTKWSPWSDVTLFAVDAS